MLKTMRLAVPSVLACVALLAGCSKTIDARQAQEIRGLIYKMNAEDPFTGTVTNYSFSAPPMMPYGVCDLGLKNGVLHGTMTCKWQNGAPIMAAEYRDGKKNGVEKHWDPNSKALKANIVWADGTKDGVEEHFNPSNGKIVSRISWQAGQKVGEEKGWDILGDTLLIDLVWKDGKQTGFHKWGEFEQTYREGQRHGIQRRYVIAPIRQVDFTKWDPHIALIGGGGYAFSQAKDAVLVEETVYENGVKVKTNIDLAAQQKAAEEAKYQADAIAGRHGCVDAWIAAYRREKGRDAPVYTQQVEEWADFCRQNRLPPQ